MRHYEDSIDMMTLLKNIAPLSRTLASDETDKALQLVQKALPKSEINAIPTGTKVWSWTIPARWELNKATIKTQGKTLLDSAWNILHVLNYSQAFSGVVSKEELLKHIRTAPDRPHAIPFSFSFYEKTWGFSIPHEWLKRFDSDSYQVEIDAELKEGMFNTLSLFIPGEHEETFVICSNICHPLQVNDSLTGLAVAVDIANRILSRANRKYSYLILVVPETIGTVAYLATNPDIISKSVGGLFSEMLGTQGPMVGQKTRSGSSYWDHILCDVLGNSGLPSSLVDFMKSASNDEKVLDSPGVDIPTFSLTRYPYPQYHTSDDNIDLIDLDRLREARNILQTIIDYAEQDYIPVLKNPGPIFLSGHGLYPNWRDDPSLLPVWESFIDVMYSIDGKHSVIELATLRNISIAYYFYWTEAFYSKGLLEKKPYVLHRQL